MKHSCAFACLTMTDRLLHESDVDKKNLMMKCQIPYKTDAMKYLYLYLLIGLTFGKLDVTLQS